MWLAATSLDLLADFFEFSMHLIVLLCAGISSYGGDF